MNPPTQ